MNSKKNILVGIAVDGKGGVDSYIKSFARVCNKNNIHIDVLTTKFSNVWEQELSKYNARLIEIANLHNKKEIYSKISTLCKSTNYAAAYWNISTCLMYPYVKASEDCGIKTVCVHAHAHYNSQPNALKLVAFDTAHKYYKKKMQALPIKYAACAKKCAEWIGAKKEWTFVPNPIDVDKCRFNINIRNSKRLELNIGDKFVVGCATAFMPYKNPLFLIEVFKQYLKQNKNAFLVVAGDGPMKNQVEEAAKTNLPNNSYLLPGHRSDVHELLQAFDCFVLPSKNEGLPLCILEAQASSLPCVMSNAITDEAVVIPQLITKLEFGDDWSKAIKSAKRNSSAADKVSNAGFNLDSPEKILPILL